MKTKDLDKAVNQLLQDPIIGGSEKYSDLLKYFAECSHKHIVPNEAEISEHLYGINQKFDPTSDASIRVLIWKLRKKIDEYYETKGKHEKFRLTIPKRKYALELVEKSEIKYTLKQNLTTILYALIAILSITLVWLLVKYNALLKHSPENNAEKANNFIFRDFANNGQPTIFAIGNLYTFTEYQDKVNSFRIIRNQLINSDEDLSKYQRYYNIPEKKISKLSWNMVPENTIKYYSLFQSVFNPLASNSLKYSLSSQIAWSDLLENNLIFVSHFHNIGNLTQFYRSRHFYSHSQKTNYSELISILENNLKLKKVSADDSIQNSVDNRLDMLFTVSNMDTSNNSILNTYKFSTKEKTNYVHDYVVLSKLPGPNSNTLLFVISFHQIGRLKVVKMITDPMQMSKFEEKVRAITPSIPEYFEMLIEVKGYQDTAMEMNILHFYKAASKFSID